MFDQGRFCETFHSDDAGWRTCNACKKVGHPILILVFLVSLVVELTTELTVDNRVVA